MAKKWRRLTAGLQDVAKRLAQARARLAAAEAAEQEARGADESLNVAGATAENQADGEGDFMRALAQAGCEFEAARLGRERDRIKDWMKLRKM